ncbi:NYN domain-containing protein [Ideonella sp. BN130291]|uniref:NYN domain-containing protein n=1 Tax=Ideonella sp. BN130291 TaxID=3112940 RepID=UPI002E26221D|nr:NYN domain-containing protein [Ideonella sp. BN130291]
MAANTPDTVSMALFCDFENVAIGVRDANYEKFDIKRVLERLLLKGSIVVKKAYCDWDRYKQFKGAMHEANFELIEIPHVRQSGKNSADIRLVVDALDLCYTKSHVNTFVIISGDSDFSPLVSKLRENAKQVIGVGVKQSTSDLLIANCDEFIFYDDLVRDHERVQARRNPQEAQASNRRSPADEQRRREEAEARIQKAIELTVTTLDALVSERGEGGKVRASVLKDAIKRRKPDFSENRYGFRSFGGLLEEAQARGQLEIERDEKSNVYIQRNSRPALRHDAPPRNEQAVPTPTPAPVPSTDTATDTAASGEVSAAPRRGRGRGDGSTARKTGTTKPRRSSRNAAAGDAERSPDRSDEPAREPAPTPVPQPPALPEPAMASPAGDAPAAPAEKTTRARRPRKPRAPKDAA